MNIQKGLLLLLICSLKSLLFCQTYEIKGWTIDANSKVPIPYASIHNLNEGNGAISDSLGFFQFKFQKLPVQLKASHIGYTSDTITVKSTKEEIILELFFDNSELPTVEVIAKPKFKSINDRSYMPITFTIWNDYVFLLSKKGSFGDYHIEVFNIYGELLKIHELDLGKVRGLEVNCLNEFYINNNHHTINFDYTNATLKAIKQLPNGVYKKLISQCKCSNENFLFLELKLYNGLMKRYVQVNKNTKNRKLIKEIKSEERIDAYREDLGFIKRGENISNTGEISSEENEWVRNTQERGDFMKTTLYKSLAHNHLFFIDNQVILFNHDENKINFFDKEGQPTGIIDISYNQKRIWKNTILLDKKAKKFYAIFMESNGAFLREIDINLGKTINEYPLGLSDFDKVMISDNTIFILENLPVSSVILRKRFLFKRLY